MKKGCLITVGVVILLLGFGAWKLVGLFKDVTRFAEDMVALQVYIAKEEGRVNELYPFESPEAVSLTAGQVGTYMAVRTQLNKVVGTSELCQKMKEMESKDKAGEAEFSDFKEMLGSIAPSAELIAKEYIKGLEGQSLSPDGFKYVTNVMLGVISIELDKENFNEEIPEDFSVQIGEMMLRAKQSGARLYQYKQELLAMEEGDYNAILDVVRPEAAAFGALADSFYFDMFTNEHLNMSGGNDGMDMGSDSEMDSGS
ncbi:MAG: hypothetical protein K9M57_07995 [Phycisphaerae bacterium]|nr:hypothetical protein [Phycisphaerae bacterium]